MSPVITTYLEMCDPAQLCAKHPDDPRFRVLQVSTKQWEYNRFLYALIGKPWNWRDKLSWTDERWKTYVESESLSTFVGYWDGSPAGYYELMIEDDAVEIAYFGLAPAFIGKGLGGPLLTSALQQAWQLKPRRVRVHTCTLDHPAALRNYLSRGMTVYRTETQTSDHMPESTLTAITPVVASDAALMGRRAS